MKRFIFCTLVLVILILNSIALADVPQIINYQGNLTDSTGEPVTDGEYPVRFRIWDDSADGMVKWTSQPEMVLVINGLFNFQLGSKENIPSSTFNDTSLWLGITVGAGPEVPEIEPRTRLTSSPYAFKAYKADYADTAEYARKAMPLGIIVMWSGTISNIPEGWALCDGNNGTPDLRDRFVKSVPDDQTDPGTTGGSMTHDHGGGTAEHVLTVNQMPPHSHDVSTAQENTCCGLWEIAWTGNVTNPATYDTESAGGGEGHSHGVSSENNLPSYYELAFIMKL